MHFHHALTRFHLRAADKKMTMHKAWVLLSSMAAQLKGVVSIPDRTVALVVGARAFLEQSYQQYIRSKLQERRSQVHTFLPSAINFLCRFPLYSYRISIA